MKLTREKAWEVFLDSISYYEIAGDSKNYRTFAFKKYKEGVKVFLSRNDNDVREGEKITGSQQTRIFDVVFQARLRLEEIGKTVRFEDKQIQAVEDAFQPSGLIVIDFQINKYSQRTEHLVRLGTREYGKEESTKWSTEDVYSMTQTMQMAITPHTNAKVRARLDGIHQSFIWVERHLHVVDDIGEAYRQNH